MEVGSEGQLRLNGKQLLLRGVNRHESDARGGIYQPWEELEADPFGVVVLIGREEGGKKSLGKYVDDKV